MIVNSPLILATVAAAPSSPLYTPSMKFTLLPAVMLPETILSPVNGVDDFDLHTFAKYS